MFVSIQFVLALMTFTLACALAFAVTFAGCNRLAQARTSGERATAGTMVLLCSGGWTLFVLGLALAIVLGVAGFSLIESAGSGGD